jgi:hypothetical protein
MPPNFCWSGCADCPSVCDGASSAAHRLSRRAIYHQLIAEDTDFLIAQDEHRFVFANLRFAGDFERAVVQIGSLGVATEEDEVHVAVVLAVRHLSVCDHVQRKWSYHFPVAPMQRLTVPE